MLYREFQRMSDPVPAFLVRAESRKIFSVRASPVTMMAVMLSLVVSSRLSYSELRIMSCRVTLSPRETSAPPVVLNNSRFSVEVSPETSVSRLFMTSVTSPVPSPSTMLPLEVTKGAPRPSTVVEDVVMVTVLLPVTRRPSVPSVNWVLGTSVLPILSVPPFTVMPL